MEGLLQNLRYSFRTWRDDRGLILTILLTMALGIGANTAIFTMVNGTLLAPLPYSQPDQLVNVWSEFQGQRSTVSAGDFDEWKRQSAKTFSDLNASGTDNFNVATGDRPEFLNGLEATTGYYAMLGSPLSLGRSFLPEEGQPGKEHVVILTNRLWRRLGADANVVGKTMQVNGDPYRVVGVMAAGTADRYSWELMVPLVFSPEQLSNHEARYWLVTGRLKSGATIGRAQADMGLVAAMEARANPRTNQGWGIRIEPFKNDFLPRERQWTLWLLLSAVGLMLLIACVNVANLLLAKGIARQREVAIRGALGAQPASIFAQFLTESVMLGVLSGLFGMAAGLAMLHGLIAVIPPEVLPAEADLRLNIPVLLVTLATATLAGVLVGGAPAWYASRIDAAAVLKKGGRTGMGVAHNWLRRCLVVSEFALALPLLAGAGLAVHSLWNLNHTDLGVRTDHILGCYLDSVPLEKNPSPANVNSYYRRILSSIEMVPGVSRACAMTYLPLDIFHAEMPFSVAGKEEYSNTSMRTNADFESVTPGCFQTFGIRILKGRGFTDRDNEYGSKVAMVNEVFANRFLRGVDPLRQQVIMDQMISGSPKNVPGVRWQIVGVFHTVKSRGSREENPEIDVPFWQVGWSVAGVGVRTAEDPAHMVKSITAAVNAVDPQAALALTRTMTQVHDQVLANDRLTAILFGSFAGVALLLAAVGIYGVMAFSVTQRSHEIALRMALGATRNRIVGLVVKEGLLLACAGLTFGLIGAFFTERAMQSILFSLAPVDLSTFAAVGLLLVMSALLASCLPAFKAASVEAMQTLRSE